MRLADLTFGNALVALRHGVRVARSGWNGRGMWLILIEPSTAFTDPEGLPLKPAPYIAMRTADGFLVPWLASQTDVLATDWSVLR